MRSRLLASSLLALVAAALLAAIGGASAQTADPTTGTSSATTNVVVNANTGPGSSSGGGADGSSGSSGRNTTVTDVRYSGHEWTTPSVQGSYFAGANPCLIGVGGSGAGGPIGLSFTFGRSDAGCQRRSDAAAWHALGHDDVAIARMCQDADNHAAFEAVGYTCPQPRPKVLVEAANAPVTVSTQPPPTPVAFPAAAPAVTRTRPQWCDTVTGAGERARYRRVCAF